MIFLIILYWRCLERLDGPMLFSVLLGPTVLPDEPSLTPRELRPSALESQRTPVLFITQEWSAQAGQAGRMPLGRPSASTCAKCM